MPASKDSKVLDIFDGFLIIVSITAYLLDTVTDVLVAVLYIQHGHLFWGSLTLGFVVVPSVAIQIFSARWYTTDGRGTYPGCWLVHVLQLQPLERYIMTLVAGLEARRYGDQAHAELFYIQQNDVSMLRLIEAFLESAPQLTLQLYIITTTDCANTLTVGCACVSLLSLGWAVAAYSHALRQAYQSQYSRHASALFTQTVCHMLIAAARVASIVAFASIFRYWVFLALGIHWLVMTIWIILQKTDFCVNEVEEKFFDCIVGIIYCFNFFNLKEGRTRWRALAFYSVMCAENAAALALWYIYKPERSWFDPLVCVTVAIAFILGISFMMMYYCFCHPSQPFICVKKKKNANTSLYMNSQTSTPYLPRQTTAKSVYSQKSPGIAYSSAVMLPRRTLLKPQPSTVSVHYKAVRTPSGLSPIKSPPGAGIAFRNKHSYNECSFDWDDQLSGYQHYSIDATAGLGSFSHRVSALQTSGIDLSREDLLEAQPDDENGDVIDLEPRAELDMGTFGVRSPSRLGRSQPPIRALPADFEGDRSRFGQNDYKSPRRKQRASVPYNTGVKSGTHPTRNNERDSLYDPNEDGYFDADKYGDTAEKLNHAPYTCVTEGCLHCGKAFPFMDQSMENVADDTVGFCNCTLMGQIDDQGYHDNQHINNDNNLYLDHINRFNGKHDQSNDTSVTDSSGFHSRASNYGNGGTVPSSVENSPGECLSEAINSALPSRLKFIH